MADVLPLSIDKRTDWVYTWQKTDPSGILFDFTGYTIVMEIRDATGSGGVLITSLSTAGGTDGTIAIDSSGTVITLTLPHSVLNTITATSGFHDLLSISPGNFRTREWQGTVNFDDYVTVVAG